MHSSAEQACRPKRTYPRISLPNGMFVAWHGGDLLLFSRVKTVSMGGLFISVPSQPTVGTKLRLAFEVPGGNVRAEGIIRNVLPRGRHGCRIHKNRFERPSSAGKVDESIVALKGSLCAPDER